MEERTRVRIISGARRQIIGVESAQGKTMFARGAAVLVTLNAHATIKYMEQLEAKILVVLG